MKINQGKIRDIIGRGGETIRAITTETGTEINTAGDGIITTAATTQEAGDVAKRHIEVIITEVEVGKVYEGTVVKILDNNVGAIVNVMPGKDDLVHINRVTHERARNISNYLQVGQVVNIRTLEVDDRGHVRLSVKALLEEPMHEGGGE